MQRLSKNQGTRHNLTELIGKCSTGNQTKGTNFILGGKIRRRTALNKGYPLEERVRTEAMTIWSQWS